MTFPTQRISVFYWTSRVAAAAALRKLGLQSLYQSLQSENASAIGLWIESFTVPKERFETIYSGNDYHQGAGSLEKAAQIPHTFTGYWGAARDRIPASSDNNFVPQFTASTPNFGKDTRRRVVGGHNYDMLLHIRSGQYWERCQGEEREAYESISRAASS